MSMIDNSKIVRLVLKFIYENTPCLNTFLFNKICEILKPSPEERKKLSDKIRYIVKKLERYGYIVTN